jgi:hypothetical protein
VLAFGFFGTRVPSKKTGKQHMIGKNLMGKTFFAASAALCLEPKKAKIWLIFGSEKQPKSSTTCAYFVNFRQYSVKAFA